MSYRHSPALKPPVCLAVGSVTSLSPALISRALLSTFVCKGFIFLETFYRKHFGFSTAICIKLIIELSSNSYMIMFLKFIRKQKVSLHFYYPIFIFHSFLEEISAFPHYFRPIFQPVKFNRLNDPGSLRESL